MNYRPRLISIRDVTSREAPAPRDADGNVETDPDACKELLFAVLETAIRDYEFLRFLDGQSMVSAPQRRRRNAILEDGDPVAFFESSWYDDICFMLGLDPGAVRDLVEARSPTSELAHAS